jgi:hypothetical protein
VNAARSTEHIQKYVASVKDDLSSEFAPEKEIPCRSIQDYATTRRVAGSSANSAFRWSYGSLAYHEAVDVAFHHCAPGYMVVLQHGRNVPEQFYEPQPAGSTGLAQLRSEVAVCFRGTSAHTVPLIMEGGLKLTLAACCDALCNHYGCPIPGVHATKIWKVASSYLMKRITCSIPGLGEVSAGSLVAVDGAYPLRVVCRVLADTTKRLWRKGASKSGEQSLFKPTDLFIAHMLLRCRSHGDTQDI